MMYKKRLQALGSFSILKSLKGDVMNVLSCLIGGHGGESNRLFLELHRTRCNRTELHVHRMVKGQKKGLDW